MQIQLLSAFPNAFLPDAEEVLTIKGIPEQRAKEIAQSATEIKSYVGHESTAKLFSKRLEIAVTQNRGNANPDAPSLIGIFVPPRRLEEGQLWAEEEILKMPIRWLTIL